MPFGPLESKAESYSNLPCSLREAPGGRDRGTLPDMEVLGLTGEEWYCTPL